ncbi:MAG TPA: ABC transporter ATP-binding protein [Phycisphaerales bacterium]|nr:ABC transporter ATP-binding protein [Phycisphaerales bacterium]HRQ74780.1 ABC transporter ATP-binding protein [Phycisphaerales bacterium]
MLTLTNLRKSFGRTVAVDGLSLEIREGEVFGLLGPNGAGKSTTINMIIGLLEPDSGVVDVQGFGRPDSPATRARIGVAPQSLALYDELSARENLIFFGGMYGMSGAGLQSRADELLEAVGLTDRAGDRVKGFSGGMKRRLNIAVALVHDPPILLLDEPTVGVDPQSRNAILETVRTLGAGGRTIIYTTHYMEEAQRLCDRVAIMDHGRLLALGTVEQLLAQHGGESVVRIERAQGEERIRTGEPLQEITRALAEEHAVLAVHIDRPNIETVFLNLTGRSLRD